MKQVVFNGVGVGLMFSVVLMLAVVPANSAVLTHNLERGGLDHLLRNVHRRDVIEEKPANNSDEVEVLTEVYTSGKRMVIIHRQVDRSIRECQIYGESEKVKASILKTVANPNLLEYGNNSSEFKGVLKECQAFQITTLPELTRRLESLKKQSPMDSDMRLMLVAEAEAFSLVIYPGTNWCGSGNVADNYNDLGTYAGLDSCCRTHDNCEKNIESGCTDDESGLTNSGSFTASHCNCDRVFKYCLMDEDQNPIHANNVGQLFFDILNVRCFEKFYSWACVDVWDTWFGSWCLEYGYIYGSGVAWRFYDHIEYPWIS